LNIAIDATSNDRFVVAVGLGKFLCQILEQKDLVKAVLVIVLLLVAPLVVTTTIRWHTIFESHLIHRRNQFLRYIVDHRRYKLHNRIEKLSVDNWKEIVDCKISVCLIFDLELAKKEKEKFSYVNDPHSADVSSEPSTQFLYPSHTPVLLMHCPLVHVN